MFSGPHAASPPKNTPGFVDIIVVRSTTGIPCLSKSRPTSRSIHGNAFSWPMARITSSHGKTTVSMTSLFCFPFSSVQRRTSISIPTSLPFSTTKRLGAWFSTMWTPSSSASSSSHGDALKYFRRSARDDLHVGTAEAARRAAAVHRRVADADDQHALADLLDVAEVRRREPLDADMYVRRGLGAPGEIQILPVRRAAADEHRVESLREQVAHARDGRVVPDVDAHVEDVADLLVEHRWPAVGTTEC